MKLMLVAALLITLPAVVALIVGVLWGNQFLVYAALASVGINFLPFLAAGWLMKKGGSDGGDLSH